MHRSPTGGGAYRTPATGTSGGTVVAARLQFAGAGSLAAAIQQAMDRQRFGDEAAFALTVDEQRRVNAVLQDWLGETDPD